MSPRLRSGQSGAGAELRWHGHAEAPGLAYQVIFIWLPPPAPTPPAFRTLTHPSGAIRAGLVTGDGRGRAVSWNMRQVTVAAGNVELGK